MKKTAKHKSIFRAVMTIAVLFLLVGTVIANGADVNKSSKIEQNSVNDAFFPFSGASKAFILTTNYLNSSFSVIDMADTTSVEKDIKPTHGDDGVRYYDGKVYVMNRFGYDCIEVFDADNNFEKVSEFSTGSGTNPHDIAFISKNKAYVTCYDSTDLLIVNPTTGERLGNISLSKYADDDGIPEMDKMTVFSFLGITRVYVSIQRLNRTAWYAPTDTSCILEINGRTNQVTKEITLTGVNPFTDLVLDGIHLLVGEAGSWFAMDGGIERINLLTGETEGFIINETNLGGNILDFEMYPKYTGVFGLVLSLVEDYLGISLIQRCSYALISDLSFNTSLVSFNEQDQSSTSIYSTDGYQLADMAISDKGSLYLADRSPSQPGIRIFNVVSGNQETTSAIDVGAYPPIHVTLI